MLDLGKGTEISSLFRYEIIATYTGGLHSHFENREGKIISCGCNDCGQLLLSNVVSDDVYSPKETITSGATFCIAGQNLSVVFIRDDQLPNTPSIQIQQHQ